MILAKHIRGLLVVLATACGSSSSNLGPTPDGPPDAPAEPDAGPIDEDTLVEICGSMPVTFDDWERCYRKRQCELEVNCRPLNTYRDEQECLELGDAFEGGRLSAELRERTRAVAQSQASINVEAFTRCLIETSSAHCNTASTNAFCATRFTGTIPDGGACLADVDCASPGAACKSDCRDACCAGTCEPKLREGESCPEIDSCEPGLRCPFNTDRCVSGDIDSPCTNDAQCDSNAWCDRQKGLCRPDFPLGSDCTNPLQCGGQASCIGVSVSTTNPGKCLRISEPGDKCDYFCYGNLACAGGICRELPGLGEGCGGLTPCSGVNAVCSNGTCVQRGDVGTACSDREGCRAGLFCTSELQDPDPTCAARRVDDEPCTDPSHCNSHLCSGSSEQPGVCLPWSDTCPIVGP